MNKYFHNIQLSIYLLIAGILAVNIHIKMLKLGIPHPDDYYIKPAWMEPLKIFTQLIAVYWISQKIKLKPHNNFKKIILLFVLFSAMMQLILRFPLTSGYANGEAFLFTWIAAYFPQLICILISSTLIVVLNVNQKISKSKT